MKVDELFELARKVETDLAVLYRDLAGHLTPESDEYRFFVKMAAQEEVHAAWVDEMADLADADYQVPELAAEEFTTIIDTIADVHDEVINSDITLDDAAEIIVHLESSTAENFYQRMPTNLPNVPPKLIARMVESCRIHARMVAREFAKE